MYFENTVTGEYGLTLDDIRRALPHISIPDHTTEIGDFVAYASVIRPTPEWNQDVKESKPVNGQQTWVVTVAEPDELQRRLSVKAEQVRADRGPMLRRSDWTQLPDISLDPAKQQEWREYRQALRDVPNQPGFPWTVIWPVLPA